MPEPISISAILTTAALTEGVKFLYSQATELLKRWRDRRETASKEAASVASVAVALPETVFEGQLSAPQIHFADLERLAEPMRQLRKELGDYIEGIETINTADEHLIKIVDVLRQTLEGVYQQRLTFKGEQRPPSGPMVEGRVDVDQVFGVASGVIADMITGGARVQGEGKAGTVGPAGDLAGVRAKKIEG